MKNFWGAKGIAGARRGLSAFFLLLLLALPRFVHAADFWRLWSPAGEPAVAGPLPLSGIVRTTLLVGVGRPPSFSFAGPAAPLQSAPEAGIFLHRRLGARGCVDFAAGFGRPGKGGRSLPLPDARAFLRLGVIF